MATVLITSEFFGKFSDEAKKMLISAGHRVIDNPYGHQFLTPEKIIPYIGEADAIICDLEKITQEVMEAAPNLKIIARRGVGVDSVDCAFARSRGIVVAKALGVVEAPVAELVMSYILGFSRKVAVMNQEMHQNRWSKMLGSSVDGKVLGIVGMGQIGLETAKRAKAFGMKICYADPTSNSRAEQEFGAERLPLEQLLVVSDFVSLHLPLMDSTRNLIGYPQLCLMKPTGILINTARGAIVDENGLAKALEEKRLAGAAVDVYDTEPKTDSPLVRFDNVMLTPHVATFTREIFIKMDILAAQNIMEMFQS